jgi:hypothetical protein
MDSEFAPKKGVRITITGEDGSRLLFFGGKQVVTVTITTEEGPSTLSFCSEADPVEDGEEEGTGVSEG